MFYLFIFSKLLNSGLGLNISSYKVFSGEQHFLQMDVKINGKERKKSSKVSTDDKTNSDHGDAPRPRMVPLSTTRQIKRRPHRMVQQPRFHHLCTHPCQYRSSLSARLKQIQICSTSTYKGEKSR
jgi:hypothetical protein